MSCHCHQCCCPSITHPFLAKTTGRSSVICVFIYQSLTYYIMEYKNLGNILCWLHLWPPSDCFGSGIHHSQSQPQNIEHALSPLTIAYSAYQRCVVLFTRCDIGYLPLAEPSVSRNNKLISFWQGLTTEPGHNDGSLCFYSMNRRWLPYRLRFLGLATPTALSFRQPFYHSGIHCPA